MARHCLTCKNILSAERRKDPQHRDRILGYWRAYKKRRGEDPDFLVRRRESYRRSRIKRSYGITYLDFDAMMEAQKGLCAICHKPSKYKFRDGRPNHRLAVDHDHATGRIRSLLCNRCNTLLGQFENNMQLAHDIFAYIGYELTNSANNEGWCSAHRNEERDYLAEKES